MASTAGYYYYSPYYQPAPYHYNYNYSPPQQRARGGWLSSVPVVLFLATVTLLVATALISWCESAVESLVYQFRSFLILSPVLLVVAVQLWVATGGGGGGLVSLLSELMTGDQGGQYYHPYQYGGGAGSTSPWGVAVALVLVLFLVS